DRDRVLREANRLREEYRRRARAGQFDSRSAARVAGVPLDLGARGVTPRLARQVAQGILDSQVCSGPAVGPGQSPAPLTGMIRTASDVSAFHEQTLRAAYRLAQKDPGAAGWVVEQFAGVNFNASVGDKAGVIVKRNPEHFRPAVASLILTNEGTAYTEQE